MSLSDTFVKLASGAIEHEVHTYFYDTALYRRLCWGGASGAHRYLHQEFCPHPEPRPPPSLQQGEGVAAQAGKLADSGVGSRSWNTQAASHDAALSPLKRRRRTIVDALLSGLQAMAHIASPSTDGAEASSTAEGGEGSLSETSASTPPTTTEAAPYTVSYHGCVTRIVANYPCSVIQGYVVLWAESTMTVACVQNGADCVRSSSAHALISSPTTTLGAREVSGRDEKAQNASRSKRVASARRAAEEQVELGHTNAALAAKPTLPPLAQRFPAAATHTAAVKSAFAQGAAEQHGSTQCTSSTGAPSQDSATVEVKLLSLHLVNKDFVRNRRPASLAIQSLLQPGMATALECYPRHMIHFGLLCYGAWHASAEEWERLLHGREAAAAASKTQQAAVQRDAIGVGRRAAKRPRNGDGGSSAAATLSADNTAKGSYTHLVPHSSEDAVLILGLGGNVLGKCLDAILSVHVPLHVVEVEPAVLQACVALGQFPPCTPKNPAGDAHGAPLTCAAAKKTKRSRASQRKDGGATDEPMEGHWCEAARLVQEKSETCVALCSTRQEKWGTGGDSVHGCQRSESSPARAPVAKEASAHPSSRRGRRSSSGLRTGRFSASDSTGQHPAASKGEYVCFLQDAYVFLRSTATWSSPAGRKAANAARPTSQARGKAHANTAQPSNASHRPAAPAAASLEVDHVSSGASTQVSTVARLHPRSLKYSMIFLDCYDPDREHMMHEGRLVELCARRLCPGGVLLVNAHVLPTPANLRRDFLSHGFATVQALRVAGTTQSVVVCIAPDRDTAAEEKKCARFTVQQLRLLAQRLNSCGVLSSAPSEVFALDAEWLKSSRRESLASGPKEKVEVRNSAQEETADLRVWQHSF